MYPHQVQFIKELIEKLEEKKAKDDMNSTDFNDIGRYLIQVFTEDTFIYSDINRTLRSEEQVEKIWELWGEFLYFMLTGIQMYRVTHQANQDQKN